tara:strand:- start:846 stop:1382 length:537 start_codon:yes stop_codon:yes gene_type:complete
MTRARDLAKILVDGFSGTELILDADGDTSITADTDDTIHFKIAGSDKFTLDPSGNMTISGTVPSAQLTGALPAISGASLTGVAIHTAFTNNTNGYCTFNNGLICQWGRQGSLSNATNTTISFPLTFPNALHSFAASWTVMTSGTHHSAFPDGSMTTSGFGAHNVSGSTNGVVYVAWGH